MDRNFILGSDCHWHCGDYGNDCCSTLTFLIDSFLLFKNEVHQPQAAGVLRFICGMINEKGEY